MKRNNMDPVLGIPSRKLGVKYLDDIQLSNTFPDWKALMQRIEEQRNVAEFAYNNKFVPENIPFPQTYDNLFAILGGRGSGKSSAILTLHSKMDTKNKRDILLPIITPEILGDQNCSILGWIMSATESVLCELEKDIKLLPQKFGYHKQFGEKLALFFKDCRFQEQNILRKAYEELFEKSVGTSKNFRVSGYSAEDALFYRVNQSRRQYQLMQDINNFWKLLSDTWYAVRQQEYHLQFTGNYTEMKQSETPVQYPLIVLMFDDIDLVPERSMELLTTTFQYFTNPNIVIIITAAWKILQQVIYLRMFERMVGSSSNSLLTDVLTGGNPKQAFYYTENDDKQNTSIEKIAREFFDKVIPPSRRYQLKRYKTISEKAGYSYSAMEQSFRAPRDKEILGTSIEYFLLEQVNQLIKHFHRPQKDFNFFLGGTKKNVFQKAYLIIFGEKSRNIENGCLEILNIFDRLKRIPLNSVTNTPKDATEVLVALRHLLQALLDSKKMLEKYTDYVDAIIQPFNENGCYINYNMLAKLYDEERQKLQVLIKTQELETNPREFQNDISFVKECLKKIKCQFVCFIMMLFFIEGVLKILYPQQQRIHGYRQLQYILNSDIIFEKKEMGYEIYRKFLFPEHTQTGVFLQNFPSIFDHVDTYVDFKLYDLETAKKYLKDIFFAQVTQAHLSPLEILAKEAQKNYDWVKNVLFMMIVRYSGITMVQPTLIQIPNLIRLTFGLFSFTNQFLEERKRQLQYFFSQSSLVQPNNESLKHFSKIVNPEQNNIQFRDNWMKHTFLNQTTESLYACNLAYNRFVEEIDPKQEYIQWYLSVQWNTYTQHENRKGLFEQDLTKTDDLCYTVVRFFEDRLLKLQHTLTEQTKIAITPKQMSDIIDKLLLMEDTSLEASKKRSACILVFQQVLESDAMRTNSLSKEESAPYYISAKPLIEYLTEVQKNSLDSAKGLADFVFYKNSDIKNYSELCQKMETYYHKSEQEIVLNDKLFSFPSILISEVKMLQFLLPYYLAAYMQIFIDSYYKSETLPFGLKNNEVRSNNSLEGKLQTLFKTLSDSNEKSPQYPYLHDLMKQVQIELAENYYEYLEASYE